MEIPMSWWQFAFAAIAYGLLLVAFAMLLRARRAAIAKPSPPDQLQTLIRRISACEELQNELVEALNRIEARDKMRRVRAAKVDTPTDPAPPGQISPVSTLPTADLRRQIAISRMRK